eukprot:jgi/Ulvmu1/5679/UM024_0026.1
MVEDALGNRSVTRWVAVGLCWAACEVTTITAFSVPIPMVPDNSVPTTLHQGARRILQELSLPLTQAAPTPLDERPSISASPSATPPPEVLPVNSTPAPSPGVHPSRPPPPPPPPASPGTAPPPDAAQGSQPPVELFPANVAVVYNLPDLWDALSRNARDIEIRSHLDLRNLPLRANPHDEYLDYTSGQLGTDLAFLSWPTRSLRGNCTVNPAASPEITADEEADEEAAQLERLQAELQGDPVPLKPFQCLLLTNANTFFLDNGIGFWLDNLYFGIMRPRPQLVARTAAAISSGLRPWSKPWSSYDKPMNIFATNVTMHGHGQEAFSSRVVSLAPVRSRTSALFQDCIFVNLVGRDPPFLIASGTYATFRNCLFRSVSLPRSELFDVSFLGTVSLQSCYFSDMSSFNGLVDTTYNDYTPYDGDYNLRYFDSDYNSMSGFRSAINGDDDHAGYDIALASAPDAVAALYGTQFVVMNETLSDCLAAQFHASDFVLPGCPSESVSERRARVRRLSVSEPASLSGYSPSEDYRLTSTFQEDYKEERTQRQIKRSNPFYDGYYDYAEVDYPRGAYPYNAEAPGPDTYAAPYPAYTDYEAGEYLLQTLGRQLTLENPWFQAVTELLPRRPPAPSSMAAVFSNGLPICTDCTAAQPSPGAVRSGAVTASTAAVSQADEHHVPTAVLRVVPAAAMLLLLAVAVGVFFLSRKLGRSAGEVEKRAGGERQARPGGRGSLADDWDGGFACKTAGLHAKSMHASLTEDLKKSELSLMESSPDVCLMASGHHIPSHAQPASALNPKYEYQLPPGLGLAMHSSTEDGTSEITQHTQHTQQRLSSGWGSSYAFSAMSGGGPSRLHPHFGTESHVRSGSGHRDSNCSTARGTWSYVPLPSTQAPHMGVGTAGTDVAAISHSRLRRVVQQLNRFSRDDRFLGRFEVLGPRHRRHGGQAVVQFVVDPKDGREFAVKFFLQEEAFRAEAALYAASFPALRAHLSRGLLALPPNPDAHAALSTPASTSHSTAERSATPTQPPSFAATSLAAENTTDASLCVASEKVVMHSADVSQNNNGSHANTLHDGPMHDGPVHAGHPGLAGAQRPARSGEVSGHESAVPAVPAVPAVCGTGDRTHSGGAATGSAVPQSQQAPAKFLPQVEAVSDDAVDMRGRRLPPCIVMEKGESLQDWSNRAEPDLFTSLAVLSNVAARLAVMHDAGLVHRDLKPANVMWLPRENRWTVIDFGCVARIGELAPLSFTLAYAPPEVVVAHEAGAAHLEASAALDAWSLGVMAYELLTGAPAFKFLTDGRAKVIARLKGEMALPWEEELSALVTRQLGAFRGPVLQLLHRRPSDRISMHRFHSLCGRVVSGQSGDCAEPPNIRT